MASGGEIYLPIFMKIGSDIRKLLGEKHVEMPRQQGDFISLLLFFFSK
jgi:hypothetical protein